MKLILSSKPAWVTEIHGSKRELRVTARPPRASGTPGEVTELRIWRRDETLSVSEAMVGSRFPKACPERHINFGGSFCLGLDAGQNLSSNNAAREWWDKLASFLDCQAFAAKHRRWPPEKGLSHGNAAHYQLAAERAADQLGLLQQYRDAVDHETGWLADPLPRVTRELDRLINGRAACPRGCLDKRAAPILRRQCQKKALMASLVYAERHRREEEAEFTRSFIKKGFACCGTMDGCPFQSE